MPGPTRTQSQELIPGYLTPLSCEFVSVSTGPAHREREWQRDSQQSPDDGRPSTSSTHSRRGPALKRKLSSSAQVPMRKRRRKDTTPINERRAEDHHCLQCSVCAAEDHGLQDPLSSGLEDLPPADPQVQTPPAPVHHSPALSHKRFKPVSEESASQERARKKSSCVDLLPLHWSCGEHLSLHSSSSGQGQKVEDQTTATIRERHAEDEARGCAAEDHGLQEALSSGVEDPQVQTPPAPVHHSPVSPAPAHNNRADATTEDDILSRYEMGRMLGEGSFGSVYEGKRLEDGLEVAVKIARKPQNMKYIYIPGHPAPVPLEVGLLILANTGPKVSEIIELLDWQDQPDQYIMVLERPSPCEDLWEFWNRHEGVLNEDTARFIMAQATVAAQMCCRRGVFHRDIKLENLLINTETLELKLIDFGCGDLLQESGYERFCGTLDYRPPESCTEGKYHGKPATVWSLGVLLFLLVCGRFPEPRDRQMMDEDIWAEPGLSNECCLLIRSLLKESPRQRIYLRKILRHEWFKVTE